jgi:hypothetical protein
MECGECEHEEDEDRQDGVCKQDDPANRCRVCPRNEPVQ